MSYPLYDANHRCYEPPEAFLRNLPREFQKEFQHMKVGSRTKLAVGGVLSDYIPNP